MEEKDKIIDGLKSTLSQEKERNAHLHGVSQESILPSPSSLSLLGASYMDATFHTASPSLSPSLAIMYILLVSYMESDMQNVVVACHT
jgi:hypothetical protein